MTGPEVVAKINEAKVVSDYAVADYVRYHGEGHFHAWEVRAAGEAGSWIVKSPTHEDDKRLLFRDLALARVGSLFGPSITPTAGLAQVRDGVAEPDHCRADEQGEPKCERQVAAPYVFATHRLGGAYKGTLQNFDDESMARIVAFCCWVDATDSEYVDGLNGRGYSIDHADSLSGAAFWQEGDELAVRFGDLARLDDGRLRNRNLYTGFLDELRRLPEEAIVAAFTGIPLEWLGSAKQRAHEARYLLARRAGVEGAVQEYAR